MIILNGDHALDQQIGDYLRNLGYTSYDFSTYYTVAGGNKKCIHFSSRDARLETLVATRFSEFIHA